MKRLLLILLTLIPCLALGDMQFFGGGGGGAATSITSGTTTITGGNANSPCYDLAGVIDCSDPGWQFNGTTNALTATTFVGALTGNASTSTALAANGTNCSAGSYPLGVDASGNSESCTVAGTGDFVGPASSTDNAVVRFDGTTGKLGQNSNCTISDTPNAAISCPGAAAGTELFGSGATAGASDGGTNTVVGNTASVATTKSGNVSVGSTASNTGDNGVAVGAASVCGTGNSCVSIGQATTGSTGDTHVGQGIAFTNGGTTFVGFAAGAAFANTTAVGYQAAPTASNQFVGGSTSVPSTDVYFGKGVTNATPTAWTLHGTGETGTNEPGAALQLAGGRGTGTDVASGGVVLQGAAVGTTGTTAQTLSNIERIAAYSTPPVVSACGTSPSTVAGTDNFGRLTTGSGAGVQACTLTFTKAFTTAPACFCNDETAILLVRATATTTTLVCDSAVAGTLASQVLTYGCRGL